MHARCRPVFKNLGQSTFSGWRSKRPKKSVTSVELWANMRTVAFCSAPHARKHISYLQKARTHYRLTQNMSGEKIFNSIMLSHGLCELNMKKFSYSLARSLSTSSYTHKRSNRAERPEWARAFMHIFYFHKNCVFYLSSKKRHSRNS